MASSLETLGSMPYLNARIEYSKVFKVQLAKSTTRERERDFPHSTMLSRFVALSNKSIL